MLCSHDKKFIYLKTRKTAGTSVEILFEKYCRPPSEFRESHGAHEHVSDYGVVGSRMEGGSKGDRFYNHMPASEIRERLGPELFDAYYKFCVVRNPFDKVVSHFWWDFGKRNLARSIATHAPFSFVRRRFARYVAEKRGRFNDRGIFMIDGQPVVAKFIRYEALGEGIAEVCHDLGISGQQQPLGRYKAGIRARPEAFADYYDAATEALVREEFAWDIAHFGYTLR